MRICEAVKGKEKGKKSKKCPCGNEAAHVVTYTSLPQGHIEQPYFSRQLRALCAEPASSPAERADR